MIYIYRTAASEGADLLAEEICLKGVRARRTRGQLLDRLQAGDRVVCWGSPLPLQFNRVGGVTTLNNQPLISKFEEAQRLTAAGVGTVQVSRTLPVVRAAARPIFEPRPYVIGDARHTYETLPEVIRNAQAFIEQERQRKLAHDRQPVAPAEEWLARRNNHVGGSDLLTPPGAPDYYSKKENIVEEYRLHMFKGKSIRAGKKVARPTRPDGRPTHPWIRSFDAGWIIAYENFQSTRDMRQLAEAALTALNLDFGAVDMGKTADGRLIVLEVNRAPGVEGNTVVTYAQKIAAWAAE